MTTETDKVWIRDGDMAVQCTALGASPCAMQLSGQEFMGAWAGSTGDTTAGFVMFPVIGSISSSGKARYSGQTYEPGKHGQARKTIFTATASKDTVRYAYIHDPQVTPGLWPNPYRLVINYRVDGGKLVARLVAENLSHEPMPYSAGLHPAFKWPLPGATTKEKHVLKLAEALPSGTTVYRPKGGLIRSDGIESSPFGTDKTWHLKPNDFSDDAFFFVRSPENRSVPLSVILSGGDYEVEMSLEGWDGFGVWSKPEDGQNFICLEPLKGVGLSAPNADAISELTKIEGLAILPPHGRFEAIMTLAIRPH
jgi:galactose mutarotase-like enzyme